MRSHGITRRGAAAIVYLGAVNLATGVLIAVFAA